MEIVLCVIIGYAFGCLSPAALIAKITRRDLKNEGTGNLGATNVTMVIGRFAGFIVMFLDVLKGFFAYKLCELMFGSALQEAGLLGGLFAVIGHVFPFYMRFSGGKGLASFAGVVLARNPKAFIFLLLVCVVAMLAVNYSFVVPFTGAVGFCVIETWCARSLWVFIFTFLLGAIIVIKHFPNAIRAIKGEDTSVREFIKKHLKK